MMIAWLSWCFVTVPQFCKKPLNLMKSRRGTRIGPPDCWKVGRRAQCGCVFAQIDALSETALKAQAMLGYQYAELIAPTVQD
jgi:hypothetical protein